MSNPMNDDLADIEACMKAAGVAWLAEAARAHSGTLEVYQQPAAPSVVPEWAPPGHEWTRVYDVPDNYYLPWWQRVNKSALALRTLGVLAVISVCLGLVWLVMAVVAAITTAVTAAIPAITGLLGIALLVMLLAALGGRGGGRGFSGTFTGRMH